MSKFVHLHTHSHYSLLDGLAKIDELILRAKELGMDSLALTDHGNLYGAVEFYKRATKAGIKPILGVEAYVAPGHRTDRTVHNGPKYHHLILLAKDQAGWLNLIQLVTKANLEGFYYKPRIDRELLKEHSEGLIGLSACLAGEVSRNLRMHQADEARAVAKELSGIFGDDNFYIEIMHHPGVPDLPRVTQELIALARELNLPLVATQDIHYLKSEDTEYHDILLAVQTGNKLNDPDRLTLKDDKYHMTSPGDMEEFFKETPDAISNTVKIAEQCNVDLELGNIKLPKFPIPEGDTSNTYLEKMIREKVSARYENVSHEVNERIAYELGVIEKMGYSDYFLIVQDFVNWAKDHGIVVGPGRGSAAGSIISYILGITGIDPLKYDLLFERFLNPDRIQMPDIDIDFTDIRRDEVLGYLRETYGENHVAQIITFGTMAARAAIRDVGRALGVSYGFCDQLAKLIPFGNDIHTALSQVSELKELYDSNNDAQRILDSAKHLEGVARHASVHACGTVISDAPLTNYLPLQRAPQDENVIISQFEMHAIEDLGLLKMDLLGLRNLTVVEEAARLILVMHDTKVDVDRLPLDDAPTFQLLQSGDTIGVFQLESAGMQRNLKDLKPTEFEDIIAMVSLYRPGPMELISNYIRRKHGQEQVTYLHPKLEPILKNTYGIMIYQEQLMQAARSLAGFTLAEADVLRKAVGKKIRRLLTQQRERLVEGMINNGVDRKTAEQLWDFIEPFARYGFNRSHAASYAMIAYQTAYLKVHYPVAFMTALLNSESGDVDRIAFIVTEAKKMGIEVLPPDINKSMAMFAPEGTNIRFGLAAVKNVGKVIVEVIIDERERSGLFTNFSSLLTRVQHKDLNKKSLESLIKCGALDSLGTERNTALKNIDEILKFSNMLKKHENSHQGGLFGSTLNDRPLHFPDTEPATPQEKLAWEKELLGLYISDHPLNHYKERIEKAKIKTIKEVVATTMENRQCRIAGIVSKTRPIVTKAGKPMLFAQIEDFEDSCEVVVFPETLTKTTEVWRETGVVMVTGKMSSRNGEKKILCDEVIEL